MFKLRLAMIALSSLGFWKKAIVVGGFLWKSWTWYQKHTWKGKHMEKPFDFKDLEARLKEAGLPEVENLAEKSFKAVTAWIKDSVILTPSKFDDFAIPVLSTIEPTILKAIGKIDGVEDSVSEEKKV